jgi:DNA-binding NarL/FixJ family response regulator
VSAAKPEEEMEMPNGKRCVASASIREMSSGDSRLGRKRLFVLSDVRLLREGLVLALSTQPSVLEVRSSALSVSAAAITEFEPDVVLLDAAERGSLELALPLRQILPNTRIVAFALADIDEAIIACAKAGISGYVSRTGSIEDVVVAVDAACRDELYCSPRTSALLFKHMATLVRTRGPVTGPEVLTHREKEIVALLEQGLSNKEIARFLRIGNATVKNHIHNILSKLQVRRRGEAAAWRRRASTGSLRMIVPGVFAMAIKMVYSPWVHWIGKELNCVQAGFI